jgi:RNA polymerase primary sigma factor
MNQWDFSFEPSPWESILGGVSAGSSLPAASFLTLMEGECEEAVEEAFSLLEERDILLDIADLPADFGNGETAVRLRREVQLVKENKLPSALEENDPLRLYLEEIAGIPVCGDVQILAEQCLAGDESAMARLSDGMLSCVVSRAYEMAGRGVLLLDLIQEGSLGLWQAILSYRGGDFEPYCDRRIRMTMAKTVVLQARSSGVGRKMRQALEDYRSVDERLLMDLGRNPTIEEIAAELHMSVEEAGMVADTLEAARMMNKAKTESQPKEETPEDEQAVEDTAYFQMRQRIQELLSSLDEQSAKLLTLRFGLEGGVPMTPEQTGKILGMTPEEVVAAEATALMKLRTNG